MSKSTLEFYYKGVQVTITHFLGYEYFFTFYKQPYSKAYKTIDLAREAAKKEIDRLVNGQPGEELGV